MEVASMMVMMKAMMVTVMMIMITLGTLWEHRRPQ